MRVAISHRYFMLLLIRKSSADAVNPFQIPSAAGWGFQPDLTFAGIQDGNKIIQCTHISYYHCDFSLAPIRFRSCLRVNQGFLFNNFIRKVGGLAVMVIGNVNQILRIIVNPAVNGNHCLIAAMEEDCFFVPGFRR